MKTKILIFITATAFLLIGATNLAAQGTNAYFKSGVDTLFQTPISEIDSVVFKQVTELSEEEVTEFFTNVENFVVSPIFQSYGTIDEMKSALENWFKQQPEVENVKPEGDILTLTFKGGATTEIKFLEQEEPRFEGYEYEYKPQPFDPDYFTDSTLQNGFAKEQSNTSLQSVMRAASSIYLSDYIYPVFWEPFSFQFSDESSVIEEKYYPYIDRFYDVTVFHKVPKLVKQDTECDPLTLGSVLTKPYGSRNFKPNLIFINTHGRDDQLAISACSTIEEYNNIRARLRQKGINISNPVPSELDVPFTCKSINSIITCWTKETRYVVMLNSADLRKLLAGVQLSSSIVFLDACNSLLSNSLSNLFIDCGAVCVYGFSDTIRSNNSSKIINKLLACLLTSEHPSGAPVDSNVAAQYVHNLSNIDKANLLMYSNSPGRTFKFKFAPLKTIKKSDRPTLSSIRSSNATEQDDQLFGYIDYFSPTPGYSKSYYGFVYSSQTSNPIVGDGKSKVVYTELNHEVFDGENYSLTPKDIEYNKQYYYRAFLCSGYFFYADEVESFMIESEKAQVSTSYNESDITDTTAVVYGNITDAGVPAYTERGICWSTNSNPTINDNKEPANGGNGQSGSYSCNLTELEPNTTYYARAYVIQNGEPVYGNTINFTTSASPEPFIELSRDQLNFGKEGGTDSITIKTNLKVTDISSSQTWCYTPINLIR